MDLTVEVRREGPGYWAHVVELPGCFAAALSLQELNEALQEALGLYLWDRSDGASLSGPALSVGRSEVVVTEAAG